MLQKTISLTRQALVPDRTQKILDLGFHRCNTDISHLIHFYWNLGMRVGISVVMDSSWDFRLLGLVVENDLLTITVSTNQSLLLQQFWNSVAICHHQVSCKQFYCLHSWHRWDQHAQVKAILAFTIESVSRCFFCPLYLHHPYHHCKTWSCSDKKQELFEFCNMFINTLLTFVWKHCLKWFIQMADDSDLMSFVCFVFFCAASKVIVL